MGAAEGPSLLFNAAADVPPPLLSLACRFIPYDQWLTTHIDPSWKVKQVKLWILSKCLGVSFDAPHSQSQSQSQAQTIAQIPTQTQPPAPRYRPASPITFAPDPRRRPISPILFAKGNPKKSGNVKSDGDTATVTGHGEDNVEDDEAAVGAGYEEDDEWDTADEGDDEYLNGLGDVIEPQLPAPPVTAKPTTTTNTTSGSAAPWLKYNINAASYTLLRFSTGQILEDDLSVSWYDLASFELLELHAHLPVEPLPPSFTASMTPAMISTLEAAGAHTTEAGTSTKHRRTTSLYSISSAAPGGSHSHDAHGHAHMQTYLPKLNRIALHIYILPYWEGYVRTLRVVWREQEPPFANFANGYGYGYGYGYGGSTGMGDALIAVGGRRDGRIVRGGAPAVGIGRGRTTSVEWKLRWVVIREGVLSVCKNREDPMPTHVLPLSALTALRGADQLEKSPYFAKHQQQHQGPSIIGNSPSKPKSKSKPKGKDKSKLKQKGKERDRESIAPSVATSSHGHTYSSHSHTQSQHAYAYPASASTRSLRSSTTHTHTAHIDSASDSDSDVSRFTNTRARRRESGMSFAFGGSNIPPSKNVERSGKKTTSQMIEDEALEDLRIVCIKFRSADRFKGAAGPAPKTESHGVGAGDTRTKRYSSTLGYGYALSGGGVGVTNPTATTTTTAGGGGSGTENRNRGAYLRSLTGGEERKAKEKEKRKEKEREKEKMRGKGRLPWEKDRDPMVNEREREKNKSKAKGKGKERERDWIPTFGIKAKDKEKEKDADTSGGGTALLGGIGMGLGLGLSAGVQDAKDRYKEKERERRKAIIQRERERERQEKGRFMPEAETQSVLSYATQGTAVPSESSGSSYITFAKAPTSSDALSSSDGEGEGEMDEEGEDEGEYEQEEDAQTESVHFDELAKTEDGTVEADADVEDTCIDVDEGSDSPLSYAIHPAAAHPPTPSSSSHAHPHSALQEVGSDDVESDAWSSPVFAHTDDSTDIGLSDDADKGDPYRYGYRYGYQYESIEAARWGVSHGGGEHESVHEEEDRLVKERANLERRKEKERARRKEEEREKQKERDKEEWLILDMGTDLAFTSFLRILHRHMGQPMSSSFVSSTPIFSSQTPNSTPTPTPTPTPFPSPSSSRTTGPGSQSFHWAPSPISEHTHGEGAGGYATPSTARASAEFSTHEADPVSPSSISSHSDRFRYEPPQHPPVLAELSHPPSDTPTALGILPYPEWRTEVAQRAQRAGMGDVSRAMRWVLWQNGKQLDLDLEEVRNRRFDNERASAEIRRKRRETMSLKHRRRSTTSRASTIMGAASGKVRPTTGDSDISDDTGRMIGMSDSEEESSEAEWQGWMADLHRQHKAQAQLKNDEEAAAAADADAASVVARAPEDVIIEPPRSAEEDIQRVMDRRRALEPSAVVTAFYASPPVASSSVMSTPSATLYSPSSSESLARQRARALSFSPVDRSSSPVPSTNPSSSHSNHGHTHSQSTSPLANPNVRRQLLPTGSGLSHSTSMYATGLKGASNIAEQALRRPSMPTLSDQPIPIVSPHVSIVRSPTTSTFSSTQAFHHQTHSPPFSPNASSSFPVPPEGPQYTTQTFISAGSSSTMPRRDSSAGLSGIGGPGGSLGRSSSVLTRGGLLKKDAAKEAERVKEKEREREKRAREKEEKAKEKEDKAKEKDRVKDMEREAKEARKAQRPKLSVATTSHHRLPQPQTAQQVRSPMAAETRRFIMRRVKSGSNLNAEIGDDEEPPASPTREDASTSHAKKKKRGVLVRGIVKGLDSAMELVDGK
ncbi:hypothetical protein Hypma_004887 [Hypsizygus marmoreus]|uniref:Uncharacterized protein n=1 Tax=Hypsizygus marmoreus TaxID=39966 RepID=A0A369KGQ7_HYPMA|nr:hypothetical protein Hypma_004887 [Hypsizygus marmoreus]